MANFSALGMRPLPLHPHTIRLWVNQNTSSAAPGCKLYMQGSDSVTRVNDSSHNFWWLGLDSSHVEKHGDSIRLESCVSQNDSTRVTVYDSRLVSESFLQNLWVPDGQTQFVCTQINEHYLLQDWRKFSVIFCTKIGGNFLFCLFSRAMLHFKEQMSPICIEGDLRHCFYWWVSRA